MLLKWNKRLFASAGSTFKPPSAVPCVGTELMATAGEQFGQQPKDVVLFSEKQQFYSFPPAACKAGLVEFPFDILQEQAAYQTNKIREHL